MTYEGLTNQELAHIADLAELAMAGNMEALDELKEITGDDCMTLPKLNTIMGDATSHMDKVYREDYFNKVEQRCEARPYPAQLNSLKVLSPLARLRREQGITQQELANLAGINIRYVQRYESGEAHADNMTLKVASAIAGALGMTLDELDKVMRQMR